MDDYNILESITDDNGLYSHNSPTEFLSGGSIDWFSREKLQETPIEIMGKSVRNLIINEHNLIINIE